jgi:hypothetical protein
MSKVLSSILNVVEDEEAKASVQEDLSIEEDANIEFLLKKKGKESERNEKQVTAGNVARGGFAGN